MKINEKFTAALSAFSLCGGVLVALSGGADSMCMLSLFTEAKKSGTFPYEIAAAHLNHSLRGDESDRDEAFCRTFCEQNGIRFFAKKLDVNTLALASGLCTEEAARNARYAFFEEILQNEDTLSYVATAHNKEDFAETMLLNLVRGSGIDGLRSIPRQRGNVIRPMLDIRRDEILAYNKENSVFFVTDSTNLTDDYSRNKIRHNVLPALSEVSHGYLDCICRTASLLSADADFLLAEAKKAYGECVQNGSLYTKKAQNLHPSILSRVIKMLYNESGAPSLEEVHIRALCDQIGCGKENFSISLPACIAICERGILRFTAKKAEATEFNIAVEINKEILLPCGITVTLSDRASDGAIPLLADALGENTVIRSRKEGDCIRVFGKTHKIKRMISDKKLDSEQKAKLFFIESDGEIIYSNLPAISDKAFAKGHGGDRIFISTKETL